MKTRISAIAVLGLPGVVACCSLLSPALATASAVSPLPASDYTVHPVCAAPAPGHAGCLAMRLVPVTAAARAHTHPLGMTRSAPIRAGSAAESADGLRPGDLRDAYFPGEQPEAPASEPQTIALVDAYNDPNAEADMKIYNKEFGLPELPKCAPVDVSNCFEKVNQNGEAGNLPFPANKAAGEAVETTCKSKTATEKEREEACKEVEEAEGWALETSTDIEVAHAVCQNCRIVLIEANSATYEDLEAAEEIAAKPKIVGGISASEISNSWGGEEPPSVSTAFEHPGTVITAAAGDEGYFNWTKAKEAAANKEEYYAGADYPATSPDVVAVGGTSLTLSNGARQSETVWNDGEAAGGGAGGGGCSKRLTAPPWQQTVADWQAVGCGSKRAVADVSADADPNTGVAVYDSVPYPEEEGEGKKISRVLEWVPIGGTSVASPIIASMFALAGGAHGVEYPAKTLYSHLGSPLLYDVTKGGNGECDGVYSSGCSGSLSSSFDCGPGALICNASTGYDGPTGVGTPEGIAAFKPSDEEAKRQTEEKKREEKLREEERQREEKRKAEELGVGSGGGSTTGASGNLGAGGSVSAGTGLTSGVGGGKASEKEGSSTLTIQLSAFALTPRALLALNRVRPKVFAVAFAFTLSAAARVRATLAKRVRVRGHNQWELLPADSLAFTAAKGRNHGRLASRGALTPGRYRLTLTPQHGSARSLIFQIG
jgi:Subtilase family